MPLDITSGLVEAFLPRRLFLFLLFFVGFYLLSKTVPNIYKQGQTYNWTQTNGTILEKNCLTIKDKERIYFKPNLTIEYIVDLKVLTNKPSDRNEDLEEFDYECYCTDFLNNLKTNKIKIFYNQNNPREFVLTTGIRNKELLANFAFDLLLIFFCFSTIKKSLYSIISFIKERQQTKPPAI